MSAASSLSEPFTRTIHLTPESQFQTIVAILARGLGRSLHDSQNLSDSHTNEFGLRAEYLLVFGEPTRSANKSWMAKRIAWRWQREALGGLSAARQAQGQELANHADLRLKPPPGLDLFATTVSPPEETLPPATPHDRRLPAPGTLLTRVYQGRRRIATRGQHRRTVSQTSILLHDRQSFESERGVFN